MSNIDYTLWPNANGNLGEIKVQIPDGINTTWPEGDALVGNFVYNKGHLVGFVDTKALIANDSKSTTFPYDYVNIQVDKSLEGVMTFNGCAKPEYLIITHTESGNSGDTVMFKYKGCKTVDDVKAIDPDYLTNDIVDGVWSESLSDLEQGDDMFDGCENLTTFNADLSNLENGFAMFANCSNLTSFYSKLSSLTGGTNMFDGCSNLTSFTSDLPSLTYGHYMFQNCENLTTFNADLSSLTDADCMFAFCPNLTSFYSDLSNLTEGSEMFSWCENLTTFNADLSSLMNGSMMFTECKLDAPSVANIAHTLPMEGGSNELGLGIGCEDTEEDLLLFAQEYGCEFFDEILEEFYAKNWDVYIVCNGRPTTTYNMRRGKTLPIYAKLEEVIMPTDKNERKPYYAYTSADGSKFYNIRYFHFTNGSTEGYDVFSSLEDAAAQMRLTKIEK